jgi:hypothetical protein
MTIEDYTTSGTTYTESDESGLYTSIVISDGDSSTTNTTYSTKLTGWNLVLKHVHDNELKIVIRI